MGTRVSRRERLIRLTKMLFDDGYTEKEVARELHLSRSTVRSLIRVIDKTKNDIGVV